jgi:NitT/TauT family transport system ATP-binding protein
VVVTHSIEEAAFLGQRILVLGRAIAEVDNPAAGSVDFRDRPEYQAMIQELRGRLAATTEPLPAGVGR